MALLDKKLRLYPNAHVEERLCSRTPTEHQKKHLGTALVKDYYPFSDISHWTIVANTQIGRTPL
jgi:hypothetical protein